MAIAAVDAVVADVVRVAELNRLLDVFVRSCDVRRAAEHHEQRDQTTDEKEQAAETGLGEEVCAAIEDLRHRELCDSPLLPGRQPAVPAFNRA